MFRAAILAAGEGSRLAAGGIETPKPLVEVTGEPMIVRLARQLREVGAGETLALVHPRAERARVLLGSAGLDVRVRCLTTPGSFHSLCALLPALAGQPFLLSLVDSVFGTDDLTAFVEAARASRADALLGVTSFVHDEAPLRVAADARGRVTAIGSPRADGSPLVTGGVYWFGAEASVWASRARARGLDRLREFLATLVEDGLEVRAHVFGRMVDVDTPEDLLLLEKREAGAPCP